MAVLGARAVYEEMFWWGTEQFLMGNAIFGIAANALLFTLRHAYLSRINADLLRPRLFVEFLLFSLVLGGVYALSDRILFVVGLH